MRSMRFDPAGSSGGRLFDGPLALAASGPLPAGPARQ